MAQNGVYVLVGGRVQSLWGTADIPVTTGAVDRSTLVAGVDQPGPGRAGLLDESSLQLWTGATTFTTSQTIENKIFQSDITVNGPNITFKNCDFQGGSHPSQTSGTALVKCTGTGVSNAVFESCRFSARSPNVGVDGLHGHDYTVRWCEFTCVEDGAKVFNLNNLNAASNVTFDRSWFHDLSFFCPSQQQSENRSHCDCVEHISGTGTVFSGNNFDSYLYSSPTLPGGATNQAPLPPVNQSGAYATAGNVRYPWLGALTGIIVTTAGTGSAMDGLVIDKNWFPRGGEFGINLTNTGKSNGSHTVTNNKVGRDFWFGQDFFLIATSTLNLTISGNSRIDDGTPMNIRKNG